MDPIWTEIIYKAVTAVGALAAGGYGVHRYKDSQIKKRIKEAAPNPETENLMAQALLNKNSETAEKIKCLKKEISTVKEGALTVDGHETICNLAQANMKLYFQEEIKGLSDSMREQTKVILSAINNSKKP